MGPELLCGRRLRNLQQDFRREAQSDADRRLQLRGQVFPRPYGGQRRPAVRGPLGLQSGQGNDQLHAQRRPQRIRHHGLVLPCGIRLQGQVPGRSQRTLRRHVALPARQALRLLPLVLGGLPHQRGGVLRTAAQDGRQPQDPALVRFARQPADRLLRLHPDHHDQRFDERLFVRRYDPRPARHGERSRVGQPDLGEGRLEEPRRGPQHVQQPPLADGRFLHPRYEGYPGQGQVAALDLRSRGAAGQLEQPPHEGV